MSRFWPHTPYAEDQPLAVPILTTHVLTRGFQCGAVIGPIAGTVRHSLSPSLRASGQSLSTAILRSAGWSSIVSTGVLAVALAARMHGREHIEWADRSWCLLENKGQVEVDDWSLGGAVVGGLATAGRRLGWAAVTGGTVMGSLAGVGGYMIWRYGIKKGRWDEVAGVQNGEEKAGKL
jgi:hypothetical protein